MGLRRRVIFVLVTWGFGTLEQHEVFSRALWLLFVGGLTVHITIMLLSELHHSSVSFQNVIHHCRRPRFTHLLTNRLDEMISNVPPTLLNTTWGSIHRTFWVRGKRITQRSPARLDPDKGGLCFRRTSLDPPLATPCPMAGLWCPRPRGHAYKRLRPLYSWTTP